MSLVFDFIIILAAVFSIYLGISRGFVRSIMHFASLILALIAVFVFTTPLSELLYDSVISKSVSNITESSLTDIIGTGVAKLEISNVLEDRPEALTDLTTRFFTSIDEVTEYYNNFLKSLSEPDAINKISEMIATPTAKAISTVIAAIILFVGSLLILKIITFILDLIVKLPVLDKLNKFLGMLFGVASALITSIVIANISVGLINSLESINSELFNDSVISGSIVLRFFFNSGLIIL